MVLSGEIEKELKLKGKGRNAFRNLRTVEENVNEIINVLEKLEAGLKSITHAEMRPLSIASSEVDKNQKSKQGKKSKNEKDQQKCMSAIDNIPKRIEFKLINLKFYIDFTLIMPAKDRSADIEGCVIYGTSKSICFTDCIYPRQQNETNCKCCDRVARCDGFEDKTLMQFSVDRNGLIQSTGEFEDVWRIKKVEQDEKDKGAGITGDESLKDMVSELHYRTMELIWPKALAWTNENILA